MWIRSALRTTSLAVVATTAALPAQNVTIIDSSTLDLQWFLDEASPGDTLLYRNAQPPSGLTGVIDKPLRLIGDGPGPVPMPYNLAIQNVDSGEVLVQNLEITLLAQRIDIVDCDASVWLADLRTSVIVHVVDSVSVVFSDAELGGGFALAPDGEAGLNVTRSTVTMTGSDVVASVFPLAEGLAGMRVDDAHVHAIDCTFQGGEAPPLPLLVGGAAVRLSPTASLIARGCSFVPGSGAPTFANAPGSTLQQSNGPTHTLRLPPTVREFQPLTYVLEGPPGDSLALMFTFSPTVTPSPFSIDTLALGLAAAPAWRGLMPASGQLSIPGVPTRMLPGVDSATFYIQLFALGSSGTIVVGSARATTLIDAAF